LTKDNFENIINHSGKKRNFMNKKLGFMIILAVCISTMAFSNENRLSFGFEYGNFFEKRTDGGVDIETYKGSPGFDFCAYHLWGNFGFFHNHSFLFPADVSSNIDGYKYYFQYNLLIGPVYKIAFTEKWDMTLGIGFSLSPIAGEINSKDLTQFNMGIGGDIGVSYLFSKMVYINIGSKLTYHFCNTTSIANGTYDEDGDENKTTEWSNNYSMVGIRPYLRIGIMLK
jgi:hypothetical protein